MIQPRLFARQRYNKSQGKVGKLCGLRDWRRRIHGHRGRSDARGIGATAGASAGGGDAGGGCAGGAGVWRAIAGGGVGCGRMYRGAAGAYRADFEHDCWWMWMWRGWPTPRAIGLTAQPGGPTPGRYCGRGERRAGEELRAQPWRDLARLGATAPLEAAAACLERCPVPDPPTYRDCSRQSDIVWSSAISC